MHEIFMGYIGTPAEQGVRLDMARINNVLYKVEVHPNRATYVKCTTVENKPASPNAHTLRSICMWAQFDNYAGLNLQTFLRKLGIAHE
jgi:hypothetical protein